MKPEQLEPMAPYLDLAYCDGYRRAQAIVDGKVDVLRKQMGAGPLSEQIATLFALEPCPMESKSSPRQ